MFIMKPFYTFIFLIGVLFSSFSHAGETLHIFADSHAKPKNWEGSNGEPRGIQIEILEEVTKRTGIEFTYFFAPWKRVFISSEAGKGGIIGFSKTKERAKLWDYSLPLYYDELVFVTTKEKVFSFNGLESLKGKEIGIKRGASYGDDFESAIARNLFKIVETADREGQMQMLAKGRLDAILLSPGRIALESLIADHKWLRDHKDNFVLISPPYKLDPNYLGIPKSMNKSHLLEPINMAIKAMNEDGTHKRIVDRITAEVIAEIHKNGSN
ncbi:MAG: amino acid ABC transporter substrate-binding protein [Rhodospirillales bacterium]|nr:amino acid ABC transporter substrate-binding protein [Rhodospirillales bacterium]